VTLDELARKIFIKPTGLPTRARAGTGPQASRVSTPDIKSKKERKGVWNIQKKTKKNKNIEVKLVKIY
jgi:hypothetical protein